VEKGWKTAFHKIDEAPVDHSTIRTMLLHLLKAIFNSRNGLAKLGVPLADVYEMSLPELETLARKFARQ
jgi:hypothetical protein